MQNPWPQQRTSCPAKHHALHALDVANLTFSLPIAVNERSSGQDSRFVSLQAVGKTLEFLDTTGFSLVHLGVEWCSLAGANQTKKLLHTLRDGFCRSAGQA